MGSQCPTPLTKDKDSETPLELTLTFDICKGRHNYIQRTIYFYYQNTIIYGIVAVGIIRINTHNEWHMILKCIHDS